MQETHKKFNPNKKGGQLIILNVFNLYLSLTCSVTFPSRIVVMPRFT